MLVTFFQLNSEWIKNGVTATCAIIGAIIAILSYNKAKYSILQSEVAKQQTKKLNDLLEIFNGYEEAFFSNIYYEIIICNLYEYGKIYGYEFELVDIQSSTSTQDSDTELAKLRNGWLILDFSREQTFSHIYQTLDSQQSRPASGFKVIDAIYITKSYTDFQQLLINYKNDPFLPKFVSKNLLRIYDQIEDNLRMPLAHALDNNLEIILNSDKTKPILPQAIYNQFNHYRIHHTKAIRALITRLHKYLKI